MPRWASLFPVAFIVLEVGINLAVGAPWKPDTTEGRTLVAETLRLTEPSEWVIDLKGEMIFRRRAFFYALESITRERMRRGLLADTIPEELVRKSVRVAALDSEDWPPRARAFLDEHFLPVGRIRVAGRLLAPSGEAVIPFDVAIAGRYAIVSDSGTPAGLLDGSPYEGPRFLEAGRHAFQPSPPEDKKLAVLWDRAAERGFSPLAFSIP